MKHQDLDKSISSRFSAAAHSYDRNSSLQQQTARNVFELIQAQSLSPNSILDIGCGTGTLTTSLVHGFPLANVSALDIASGMIDRARHRLPDDDIEWITADIRQFKTNHRFDLIASNATLHWIAPLSAALQKARELLHPQGSLIFSIMLSQSLAELRESRRRVAPHKMPSVTLPKLGTVVDTLTQSGFSILFQKCENIRCTSGSPQDLVRSLHHQGVTAGPQSSRGVHLSGRELQQLYEDYATNYSCDTKGVYATYEVLYIVAT